MLLPEQQDNAGTLRVEGRGGVQQSFSHNFFNLLLGQRGMVLDGINRPAGFYGCQVVAASHFFHLAHQVRLLGNGCRLQTGRKG
ncbi:hypothetical protein D3C76_1380100 [compost metagenome]